MAEDLVKIQQNIQSYMNDEEMSKAIRESCSQIEQNEKNVKQINEQTKEILEGLKGKGIDPKTFKYLMSQKKKTPQTRDLEIETMEESNTAVEKIFSNKRSRSEEE